MAATNPGARRAAALWSHLQVHGSISNREFARLFDDLVVGIAGDELPGTADGLSHARERAIADLEAIGIPINRTRSGIQLGEFQNPGTDRFFKISGQDRELLTSIHHRLQDLDPATAAASDPTVFVKHHVDDIIEITYGKVDFQGIPRRIVTRDIARPLLVMQNRSGLQSFYVDAITRVKVIRTQQHIAYSDGADPTPIDAEPVKDPALLTRGRGRPNDSTTLRLAQKTLAVIRSNTDASGLCDWKMLQAATGDSRSKLESLSNVIETLDSRIMLTDDGYEVLQLSNATKSRFISGGEALVATLEISAALSLGSGFAELLPECSIDEAADLASRMSSFLSRIDLQNEVETPEFGAELVAASLGHYPIGVTSEKSADMTQIHNPGLRWDGSTWWVVGTTEGDKLDLGELCLRDITQTE
jgi:hypothetical protein